MLKIDETKYDISKLTFRFLLFQLQMLTLAPVPT